jgi:hypothetical protein
MQLAQQNVKGRTTSQEGDPTDCGAHVAAGVREDHSISRGGQERSISRDGSHGEVSSEDGRGRDAEPVKCTRASSTITMMFFR